jgi:hypothetical protein
VTNENTILTPEERIIKVFVDWLYDQSPVWPDDVPRETLLATYRARPQEAHQP